MSPRRGGKKERDHKRRDIYLTAGKAGHFTGTPAASGNCRTRQGREGSALLRWNLWIRLLKSKLSGVCRSSVSLMKKGNIAQCLGSMAVTDFFRYLRTSCHHRVLSYFTLLSPQQICMDACLFIKGAMILYLICFWEWECEYLVSEREPRNILDFYGVCSL